MTLLRHGLLAAVTLACAACFSQNSNSQSSVMVPSQHGELRLTTLVQNLQNPWGLAFLPDGRLLITERPGRLRLYANGTISSPLTGLPQVWANGQGGLLDVAIDPQFAQNRRVYLSYAEVGSDGKAGTAVARAVLNGNALEQLQVIFRQSPKLSTGNHFGSRLVFDRQGYLFITLGENNERISSQYLTHHQGKVVRLWPDGSVPQDNPFVGRSDAKAEIWSYGHRNPQGATLHPSTGVLWVHEHGPQGGDEINLPEAGKNYGWPVITYGEQYGGGPIPESVGTSAPGMEQPLHYWTPSIGASGMAFYWDDVRHPWHGHLFVGALASQRLVRLKMQGGTVIGQEVLLNGLGYRVRAVVQGPDKALYLLTDSSTGRLLKLDAPMRRQIKIPQSEPAPSPRKGAPGKKPDTQRPNSSSNTR